MPRGMDEERRQLLLGQIEGIMLAEGFARLHVGDLADRVRCSRSTLYRLAPSKDELVLLVFRRLLERSFDRCREEALKHDEPAERIRAYFMLTNDAMEESSRQFWLDVQAWPPTARLREEAHHIVGDDVAGFIVEGIARGTFRQVNPRFVAYMAWLGSIAAHKPAFLEETGLTWAEAMQALTDLLLSGLAAARTEDIEAEGVA